MDMVDANSAGGLSIPGSTQRRKKAYSVSLHENNFDISEVPCLEEVSSSNDGGTLTPVADKCINCGQNIPPSACKENDVRQSRPPITNHSPRSQNIKRIPGTELQPVATSQLVYVHSCIVLYVYQLFQLFICITVWNMSHVHPVGKLLFWVTLHFSTTVSLISLIIFTILVIDHCHRARVSTVDSKAKKKLIIASVLCLVFMVGEVVGILCLSIHKFFNLLAM